MKRLLIFSIIALFLIGLTPFLNAQGEWKTKIAYDGSNRIQYVGKAVPGTATSDSLWQIKKFFYDGATTRIVDIVYANGNPTHKYIWDNRTTYTYTQ